MRRLTPGDWQTDAHGRRFRKIGNSIEHEMTVRRNGIDVPVSELDDYNRAEREASERFERENQKARTADTMKLCPLAAMFHRLDCQCRSDCALYGPAGCELAQKPAARDTAGLRCPLNISGAKCAKHCEFYKGGCTLTAAMEGR